MLIDLLIIQLCFQNSIDKVKNVLYLIPLNIRHVFAFEKFVSGLRIRVLYWASLKGA